jgi:CBS domain-containing protein
LKELRARDVMAKDVFSVSPERTLLELEQDLARQRITGAPVIDHGRVVGIVSRADIDARVFREQSRSAATALFYQQTELEDGPAEESSDPTASALESLRRLRVRDVMTRNLLSVGPDDPVPSVARVMRDRRIHRVLVLEGERLVGIVSSFDVVRAVADLAER